MERFIGLLGILFILSLACALSNNRKAISIRVVSVGLAMQVFLAIFLLKVPFGRLFVSLISQGVKVILDFSQAGSDFAFGALVSQDVLSHAFGEGHTYIFALDLLPKIIFVGTLVGVLYHLGWMQKVVQMMARGMTRLMGVSGSESLSNVASVFVGNIEAQLMIKPYVDRMTQSELMASMSGSLACIAGTMMAIYIGMGIPAEYILSASMMAAPGALVISKIMHPETQASETRGQNVTLSTTHETVNIVDAAARGAGDGMKIGVQVVTMLIGFLALVAMINGILKEFGAELYGFGINLSGLGLDIRQVSLENILALPFSLIALLMGIPPEEAFAVAGLLGSKLVTNEFMAYKGYLALLEGGLSLKAQAITTVALCGFANFGSVAMQIGGIGQMAPSRKTDLAKLGLRALIAGSLASYLSAAIVGVLI